MSRRKKIGPFKIILHTLAVIFTGGLWLLVLGIWALLNLISNN